MTYVYTAVPGMRALHGLFLLCPPLPLEHTSRVVTGAPGDSLHDTVRTSTLRSYRALFSSNSLMLWASGSGYPPYDTGGMWPMSILVLAYWRSNSRLPSFRSIMDNTYIIYKYVS